MFKVNTMTHATLNFQTAIDIRCWQQPERKYCNQVGEFGILSSKTPINFLYLALRSISQTATFFFKESRCIFGRLSRVQLKLSEI